MKCPHCQADNSEKAKYCGVCGQAIVAKTICLQCKHENPGGFKFCEECGQALASTPTPRPALAAKLVQPQPTSFANGRYQAKKFQEEGGKKKPTWLRNKVDSIDLQRVIWDRSGPH